MQDNGNNLAVRLRRARLETGLTQQKAGEAIGVDPNTIARYEAGRLKPSSTALTLLCQIYEKPIEWFHMTDVGSIAEPVGQYRTGSIPPGPFFLTAPSGGTGGGMSTSLLEELGPHGVPVVGTVSAGGMVEGWGEDLGYFPVTWELLRRSPNAKALRVSGNSLASEGIYDGDIVILDPDDKDIEDGKLYAVRSEEHNQTMAARKVFTVGRRRLKLVSGDGEVVEVARSRTVIEGRIIKSFSERDH